MAAVGQVRKGSPYVLMLAVVGVTLLVTAVLVLPTTTKSLGGFMDWTTGTQQDYDEPIDVSATLAGVTASFTITPPNPMPGDTITVDASGSSSRDGTITTYEWDFNSDGTIDATGVTATHTYGATSTPRITLTVTDDEGNTVDAAQTLTVGSANTPPIASFTAAPTTPVVGDTVTFDAAGSSDGDGTISTYAWDMDGDGTIDKTGATATHTYTAPGSYTARLTVTDDDGATDTHTQTVSVSPGNLPPTASFSHTPTTPVVGDTVTFDAAGSSDGDGTISTYAWDMDGDGATDATGVSPTHVFTTTGSHPVTLTVTDDDGATATQTLSVSVGTSNTPPTATITYTPVSPIDGTPITFDGSSSTDSDGSIVSYAWDVNGDGATDGTGTTFTHTYPGPGTFTVRLTVTDDDGAGDVTTTSISVSPTNTPPIADFSYTPGSPMIGDTVSFDATTSSDSDGSINTYAWDFDDDGVTDATGSTVSHAFPTAGSHPVTLTVTDDDGATDTRTTTITVAGTNPITTITSPATGTWQTTDFAIDVVDSDADDAVTDLTCEYRIDTGNDGWDTPWMPRPCNTGNSVTVTVDAVGSGADCVWEGVDTCKIQVRVTDPAGNTDTVQRVFSIDHSDPAAIWSMVQGADNTDTVAVLDLSTINSLESPVTDCRIDWTDDGVTDQTITINAQTYSGSWTYDYGVAGTYTTELSCRDAAGNLYRDTRSITVPAVALLTHNIRTDLTPDTVTDQSVFVPKAEIDTNADQVLLHLAGNTHRLYDDGMHADNGASDGVYANTVDITGLLGDENLAIEFVKGGQADTVFFKTVTFKRTPPAPTLAMTKDASGVTVDVSTNYPAPTTVDFELSVRNGGTERHTDMLSATCDGTCSRSFSFVPQSGDTAEMTASQTHIGLTSPNTTAAVTFSSVPALKDLTYINATGTRLAQSSYWATQLWGVSKDAFTSDNISTVYLTANGNPIGTVQDMGTDWGWFFSGELNPERLARWNATIRPSEFPGDTVDVTAHIELDDGTHLTHPFESLTVVDDTNAPTMWSRVAEVVGRTGSGDMEVKVYLQDDLSHRVDCTARVASTGDVMGDCSVTANPGLQETRTVTLNVPVTDAFGDIEFVLTDAAGNTRVVTHGPVVFNPSTALQPVEVNGDPRNKMNMLVYGEGYTQAETTTHLNTDINYFFTSGHLRHIGDHRGRFNWYVLNTDKELCSQIDGYGGNQDCPELLELMESLQTGPTIQGGEIGRIIISSQSFRAQAFPASGYTIIDQGGGGKGTFAHELGHLVWGFEDEYGTGNTIEGLFETRFFPDSLNTASFNVSRYPNAWKTFNACNTDMNAMYPTLSPSDCYLQSAANGYIVYNGSMKSFMHSSSVDNLYEHHITRIDYLLSQSGVYQ